MNSITSSVLVFFVNGKKILDDKINPEWTLLYYLRNKLRLCGTKMGCAEGGCGACTVMVSKYDRTCDKVIHLAVNACLAPICSMHGLAVTTTEGIGSTKTRLHPVQERIAKAHGSQCGFCTPGMVMSMYALLQNMSKPSMKDLDTAFQGNLCRCTGYRPIIEGYKTFTEEWEQNRSVVQNGGCQMGDQCCKVNGNPCAKIEEEANELFEADEFVPYDPTQELIFPPELKLCDLWDKEYLVFRGPNVTWYRPKDMEGLLELKTKYPNAKLIVGNTELGVEVKFKDCHYPIMIQPTSIDEMVRADNDSKGIIIGAGVTLANLETVLKDLMRTLPECKSRIFVAIVQMLDRFAGKQIRNVAAVGGNIMTGSPISDLNPIFMAAKVELELRSAGEGTRKVLMNDKFFIGYRKSCVKDYEILTAIKIPYTSANTQFAAYKQSRRRDDDIAIVNAAFSVSFAENTQVIQEIRLAFGGMGPTTILATKTAGKLKGLPWNEDMLHGAYESLTEELPLQDDAPGGMIQYRRSLVLSMFFKFFLKVCDSLQINLATVSKSGISVLENQVPKSSQFYQMVPDTQEPFDTIGRPIIHVSAIKHATGEAIYIDDMPKVAGELYMSLVLSTRAHAKLVSIDASQALGLKGVHAFFSAKDVDPQRNLVGVIEKDEEVFVSRTVTGHGQILGIIIADDELIAKKASKLVRVTYEDLLPVILSIEDAVRHYSYFPGYPQTYSNGDVENVFENADHVLEGTCRTGAQEHFYMETQTVLVVPKMEDDEIEVYAATQAPSDMNQKIGNLLDIPYNRIVTKVKRIGGGFGGKDSKSYLMALPAAFAAKQLNRPIRCVLDRDVDMAITGARHPFLIKYKVGFTKDAKLLGCEIHMYSNGGYSRDFSYEVMWKAKTHFQNSYNIPVVKTVCYVCKTNLCSNTAFRGFGAPQAMFAAENMIRDVAEYLNKSAVEVARLNLYQEEDVTFYNQTLTHCTLSRCWEQCLEMAQYERRVSEIDKFNKESMEKARHKRRVNDVRTLVHVYTDGSVLLSHGGMEMGQGLHTKMIQIASRVLEIPVAKIHISETSTDKVPNTIATAASVSSDNNGMAVLQACETIKTRLQPYKLRDPKGSWESWVSSAYLDRVSLSSTGFYKTPDIGTWDPVTNKGLAFSYHTYGVACTEAEIDCLTGDHRTLRTDIVMDLGDSLNPAIDVGQIEGAFMQGYGLYMLEEVIYLSNGAIFTRGPGTYKIPAFSDIPVQFNVSLLKGAPNPRAVYSSKAVGEPPLFLASSALFAVREAIKEARKDAGVPTSFRLNAPATAAAIRMACEDDITEKFAQKKKDVQSNEDHGDSAKSWNILP